MSTERIYGWDEPPIDKPNESSFTLLEPGNYRFRVIKFERGRHEGSAKLPACPKAIVYVDVEGQELKSNLFLHSKCEGLLCKFFASIGLRKHGEPLRMAWNEIVGREGVCKISVREGTDKYAGKKFNEIAEFLDPDAEVSSAAAPEIPF